MKTLGRKKSYLLSAIISILILSLHLSVYTIDAGKQAIVTQFGTASKSLTTERGLHLKIPFLQKVHYLPNHRVFELSVALASDHSLRYRRINIELRIQYKIGDPLKYYENFGTDLDAEGAINNALKASFGTEFEYHDIYEVDNYFGAQKEQMIVKESARDVLLARANALLKPKGLQIISLKITISP